MAAGEKARGRPRDADKDDLILKTAAAQFRSRGYEATTLDAVAKQAGIGKQSIYRRWPSKADLALTLLRQQAQQEIPTNQGLIVFLEETGRTLSRSGSILRALMAAAQSNPDLLNKLKAQLIEPRRASLAVVLEDMPEAKREWAIAAIFGAVWYRLLLDEPLDGAFARGISALLADNVG